MSEENKEIIYTTSEILEMKEEYDSNEKYQGFITTYSNNMEKYKDWSEFMLETYIGEFNDVIFHKIEKYGNVEISCGEYKRDSNDKNITFCTVAPEGQKPIHLGFEVPKELFRDFVMLSIAPLDREEINKIKEIKILL